eukprot:scaffold400059_cov18-Prasinocladus_malaysianus.AAC.1
MDSLRGAFKGAVSTVMFVCEQKGDFLIVRVMVEHGVTADFVDNDVVVLVKDNPDTDEGWDAVNPQLHCLGQVAALSDTHLTDVSTDRLTDCRLTG